MNKKKISLTTTTAFLFIIVSIAAPPDKPITPQEMHDMLGIGMNGNWLAFDRRYNSYTNEVILNIAEKGFSNIRLRTDKLPTQDDLFTKCDRILADILKTDIIPVLAYSGSIAETMLEEGDEEGARQRVIEFWANAANYYKDTTHRLVFDLMVEVNGNGPLTDNPQLLNDWYEEIVDTIRKISPTRILFLSPVGTSYPDKLCELVIPDTSDKYIMVQTHFYASGPKPYQGRKIWHLDVDGGPTLEDRKRITDLIDAALHWEDSTGILTWIGEWMPSNYNKGDDYSVSEQVVFANFVRTELAKADIPWSLNEIHKFYDAESNTWITNLYPVLQELISTDTTCLVCSKDDNSTSHSDENCYTNLRNFPNPFSSTTTIEFDVTSSSPVTLIVYNSLGVPVTTVYNGEKLSIGKHTEKVCAGHLPDGVYYCYFKNGNTSATVKMLHNNGNTTVK